MAGDGFLGALEHFFADVVVGALAKVIFFDVAFWTDAAEVPLVVLWLMIGAVYCTHFALPHLKKSRGLLVAVSSLTGKTGVPTRTGYAASKHAMQGFFDSLRIELHGGGVDVLVVSPGFVATERTSVELREYGFDPSSGLPVENPGRVCAMLATARDPMFFSGRDLRGPEFHAEHAQVRFDDPRDG